MKNFMQGGTARGRTRPVIAGLLAVASVAGAVGVAAAAQGDVNDLRAVGPISTQNGYPIWYSDEDGTEVELCLDQNPLCRYLPTDVADPNKPISFPDNYPGETFWWAAESSIDDGLTKKVVLVMALEAAFASGEVAKPGDQVSFGRIRVRMDDLIPFATYKVTHPYGVQILEADDGGRVFATEDIGAIYGAGGLPVDVQEPDLRQFPGVGHGRAPAGYLGDPNQEHTVIGQPDREQLLPRRGSSRILRSERSLCPRGRRLRDGRQLRRVQPVLGHGQAPHDLGCADDAGDPCR